jgi:endoglucanase
MFVVVAWSLSNHPGTKTPGGLMEGGQNNNTRKKVYTRINQYYMKSAVKTVFLILLIAFIAPGLHASKLTGIKVLDRDYLIVHFKDGDVKFVDDGTGPTAFAGHSSDPDNSYVVTYGEPLNTDISAEAGHWKIVSDDDTHYGPEGVLPVAVFRKTRVNGMSYTGWDPDISDHGFDYTKEHFIYIQLPSSMQQGNTYTLKIDQNLGSDVTEISITYDIFNNVSEAVHVNLVGYLSNSRIKPADLYHFMGDGGNRDYSKFEGNEVYIYDVNSEEARSVGKVAFWMESQTESNWNLTGSDVWTADFTGFNKPGTYRLVVEGVGASQDFEIRDDIYRVPYKVSILGYYYMRIGEDRMDMVPVPRRPLWIQDADPPDTKIIITDMHPFHPEWRTFSSGDAWDRPVDWIPYIKSGSPTNPNAIGGHSDALDWDRHLGHVVNVYDLLLAYIMSDGTLDDDDLRIAESGNGIPDILDEARNEVDFWLNLRYQGGYSHGLTNPDGNNRLYQAGNTAIAAWANALNSAMMSYCFLISGHDDLANAYRDSAIVAFNYAEASPEPMLDDRVSGIRGRDFKMMTAAYLYNITGDTHYEDILKNESMITAPDSEIHQRGHNQLWGAAAYLFTKRPVNYPELLENMKLSIIAEAKEKEAGFVNKRPSRRGYAPEQAWWQTNQDMHRTIIAHAVTDNQDQKTTFLDALLLEAGWGLGRNPLNKIQMTTATTDLSDKRSFENIYTSGRNDGSPGLHPGHTPYLNTVSWGGHMVGSNPGLVFDRFNYPEIDNWPHAEKYINTRFIWTHSEFTPRQTMRGKALLYAYLYGLYKNH